MNINNRKIFAVIRIVMGLWLILSGFLKLIDLNAFLKILEEQGLIPPEIYFPFTIILCLFEVNLGAILIMKMKRIATDLIVLTTFTGFLIVQIILYIKDKSISCGCYGSLLDNYITNEISMIITFMLWILSQMILVRDLREEGFIRKTSVFQSRS